MHVHAQCVTKHQSPGSRNQHAAWVCVCNNSTGLSHSHTCKQDAQAEELHVNSADRDEARAVKEAKDDSEDEDSKENF